MAKQINVASNGKHINVINGDVLKAQAEARAARRAELKAAREEAAQAEAKAAQQAELKRLRKEKKEKEALAVKLAAEVELKRIAALQAVEQAALRTEEPKVFVAADEDASRAARMAAAMDVLMEGFELPSWKRVAVSFVCAVAAAAGVGVLVGTLGGMLMVGAVAVTGAAWVGWIVWALAIIAGAVLGGKAASWVFYYIAEKRADVHVDAAKTKVGGWFNSSKDKVTAVNDRVMQKLNTMKPVAA